MVARQASLFAIASVALHESGAEAMARENSCSVFLIEELCEARHKAREHREASASCVVLAWAISASKAFSMRILLAKRAAFPKEPTMLAQESASKEKM